MKKILLIIIGLICCGLFFSGSGLSSLDGEGLFNTKCGKCHTKEGEAPVFSPVKYASSQWERFFSRNKHKRKKNISDLVTNDEIEAIKEYLINHAADSDRPIAAGLR